MNIRHVALAMVASTVLLLPGCRVPGETGVDLHLQNDIQNIINANEIAHGHPFGGKVVNTKLISRDKNGAVEQWMVKRGDHEVTYVFRLMPDPNGGTFIQTTLPDEDVKK